MIQGGKNYYYFSIGFESSPKTSTLINQMNMNMKVYIGSFSFRSLATVSNYLGFFFPSFFFFVVFTFQEMSQQKSS